MTFRPLRDISVAIPLYNNTLQNCFPGNCRTIPFISSVNRVARTSEEFKPERSTTGAFDKVIYRDRRFAAAFAGTQVPSSSPVSSRRSFLPLPALSRREGTPSSLGQLLPPPTVGGRLPGPSSRLGILPLASQTAATRAQTEREARPGVSPSASQEREVSSCIGTQAYWHSNVLVKYPGINNLRRRLESEEF